MPEAALSAAHAPAYPTDYCIGGRHPCALRGLGCFLTVGRSLFWSGPTQTLSARGLSMRLAHGVEPEIRLEVHSERFRNSSQMLVARLVHCTPRAPDEGVVGRALTAQLGRGAMLELLI